MKITPNQIKQAITENYHQKRAEHHNPFTAALSSVKNSHKNAVLTNTASISELKGINDSIAAFKESREGRKAEEPFYCDNVKIVKQLFDSKVKLREFEKNHDVSSLKGSTKTLYGGIKQEVDKATSKVAEDLKMVHNITRGAQLLTTKNVPTMVSTIMQQYAKNESPVRTSTILDINHIETVAIEINKAGTNSNTNEYSISDRGEVAGQIIKKFMTTEHSVHISHYDEIKGDQNTFNNNMNQKLGALSEQDREVTTSLFKAFAAELSKGDAAELFKSDFDSTFFSQATIETSRFIPSCHGAGIAPREALADAATKMKTYLQTYLQA